MVKYFVGLDSGSRMTKIVVLDNNKIVHWDVCDTGINPKKSAKKILDVAAMRLNTKDFTIFSTGYGRNIIPFSEKKIAEISCHAKGVKFLFPQAKTVIDIGGQDSKIILVNSSGKVTDFVMNDKCAAGTGRFLEVTANILEKTVDELGPISLNSINRLKMNSTCVVFAESEIIGLISEGNSIEDIIMSVHLSIAKRTKSLFSQLTWQQPVIFTGGVAKNIGMHKALSDVLQTNIKSPEEPLITGALGAAVFASESE